MIRPYRPADLPALKHITAVCFSGVAIDQNIEQHFGLIGGRDWQFRKLRHIDDDVAGERAHGVFVWEEGGEVVGYITTRIDHESKIGGIPNIAILPHCQGKGLGRQLIEHGLAHLRANGVLLQRLDLGALHPRGAQVRQAVLYKLAA